MSARKLDTFFSEPASPLHRLSRMAQRQLAVSRIWESIVPIGLARSCRVGRLEEDLLTLVADNGAIASKINLQLPRLQAKLQKRGCQVTKIRVLVQVKAETDRQPFHRDKSLTAPAIAELERLESKLPESKLKQALTNLIQRQKN